MKQQKSFHNLSQDEVSLVRVSSQPSLNTRLSHLAFTEPISLGQVGSSNKNRPRDLYYICFEQLCYLLLKPVISLERLAEHGWQLSEKAQKLIF